MTQPKNLRTAVAVEPPVDQPPAAESAAAEPPAAEPPAAEPPVLQAPEVARHGGVEHTTRDGQTHEPDTTVELSAAEARHVLHIGHGRTTAPKENQS
jgi:hypothetical protein